MKQNFAMYGLLDERVVFLKGWFANTLPTAPIKEIALLRIDGDAYASTMDVLNALYNRVVPGGYVMVSYDKHTPYCRQAVCDYRMRHGITDALQEIDGLVVYWKKSETLTSS